MVDELFCVVSQGLLSRELFRFLRVFSQRWQYFRFGLRGDLAVVKLIGLEVGVEPIEEVEVVVLEGGLPGLAVENGDVEILLHSTYN